jgi:hypothetical protein
MTRKKKIATTAEEDPAIPGARGEKEDGESRKRLEQEERKKGAREEKFRGAFFEGQGDEVIE